MTDKYVNYARNTCKMIAHVDGAYEYNISAALPFMPMGLVSFSSGESRLHRITHVTEQLFESKVGLPLVLFDPLTPPDPLMNYSEFTREEWRNVFSFKTLETGQMLRLNITGKFESLMIYGTELYDRYEL